MIHFLLVLFYLKFLFTLSQYVARSIEKYRTKLSKINCYIDFLLTCKRNNLIPTFAQTKLAVKVTFQLCNKISRKIIDAELNNKHRKKKIILNKIKKREEELKSRVGYATYVVFITTSVKLSAKKENRLDEDTPQED